MATELTKKIMEKCNLLKVEIVTECANIGTKKGQVFYAEIYRLDPSKLTLLNRISKKGVAFKSLKMCNEYKSNLRILNL